MSGVIDNNGQQWEHCCQCGQFVRFEALRYAHLRKDLDPKWPEYGHHTMLDLCEHCAEPVQ